MNSTFDRWSAVVVLALSGLSWPVMEVLGNNVEFFIARGSTKADIWVTVIVVGLMVPLILASMTLIPGRAGSVLADLLISVLALALAFLFFRRLPGPDWIPQVLAVTTALAAPILLRRWRPLRSVFHLLAPAPLLAVFLFVLTTPTGGLMRASGAPVGSPVRPATPRSVVFIVLDEFPVASLIDPAGNLREDQFPNFARLAREGIWFRNAVTVQQQTEHSVPAILTGINPDSSLEPLAAQYPNTIFTALALSHRMRVNEAITRLCPVRVCGEVSTESAGERARAMMTDTVIIAGHTLLPAWATEDLPAIDRSWGDFGAEVTDFNAIEAFNEASASDPRLKLINLSEQIRTDPPDRPTFYFDHVLLPHFPWRFLPTGQSYPLAREKLAGSVGTGWGDNEWLSVQALQRHLLQVEYVDRALGEVIEAMEEAGIYQQAMLIVVADHGIALKPNIEHWRRIEPDTVGEVAAIPLFVRVPGVEGGIDDRRALTVDIVPTIADALDFRLPWNVLGASLLGPPPDRSETTTVGPVSAATFGPDGKEKLEVAARNAAWFPTGDPFQVYPGGAPQVLGQAVADLVAGEAGFSALITHPEWYREVDPGSDSIPALISGTLLAPPSGKVILGVALNGRVEAVTESYLEEDVVRFQALLPPDRFRSGENQIEMVWLDGDQARAIPVS
jgi:hypothetical protein